MGSGCSCASGSSQDEDDVVAAVADPNPRQQVRSPSQLSHARNSVDTVAQKTGRDKGERNKKQKRETKVVRPNQSPVSDQAATAVGRAMSSDSTTADDKKVHSNNKKGGRSRSSSHGSVSQTVTVPSRQLPGESDFDTISIADISDIDALVKRLKTTENLVRWIKRAFGNRDFHWLRVMQSHNSNNPAQGGGTAYQMPTRATLSVGKTAVRGAHLLHLLPSALSLLITEEEPVTVSMQIQTILQSNDKLGAAFVQYVRYSSPPDRVMLAVVYVLESLYRLYETEYQFRPGMVTRLYHAITLPVLENFLSQQIIHSWQSLMTLAADAEISLLHTTRIAPADQLRLAAACSASCSKSSPTTDAPPVSVTTDQHEAENVEILTTVLGDDCTVSPSATEDLQSVSLRLNTLRLLEELQAAVYAYVRRSELAVQFLKSDSCNHLLAKHLRSCIVQAATDSFLP